MYVFWSIVKVFLFNCMGGIICIGHLIKCFFSTKGKTKLLKLIYHFNSSKVPLGRKNTKVLCHYSVLLHIRMHLSLQPHGFFFFSAGLFFVLVPPSLNFRLSAYVLEAINRPLHNMHPSR